MRLSRISLYWLILSFATAANAQKEIAVNYFTPYQYHKENNQHIVKAWLPASDLPGAFSVFLDGRELRYVRTAVWR